ncbi:MAG: helix-turn-helix domain-containing protein [Desulfuromonadaceae bacterium]|nr:helix-turn-helix domain-containing protein [Desulfuromonadaceae bacterium]
MNHSGIPHGKISSPEQLGTLIRQIRKEQGITQEALSSLIGVGPRLIGEIERGKPTAEIGKVFQLLVGLGLVLSIQPRTTRDHRE